MSVRYTKLVRLTEAGLGLAEVFRCENEIRSLVEHKLFGYSGLLSIFNRPLVNLDRAHQWAEAKIKVCEWGERLLRMERIKRKHQEFQ